MQAVIAQTILDLDKCCSFHGIDSGPQLMDELYFATRLRGLVAATPNDLPSEPKNRYESRRKRAGEKRGSSRGLVHYIAHSKVDPEKESRRIRARSLMLLRTSFP